MDTSRAIRSTTAAAPSTRPWPRPEPTRPVTIGSSTTRPSPRSRQRWRPILDASPRVVRDRAARRGRPGSSGAIRSARCTARWRSPSASGSTAPAPFRPPACRAAPRRCRSAPRICSGCCRPPTSRAGGTSIAVLARLPRSDGARAARRSRPARDVRSRVDRFSERAALPGAVGLVSRRRRARRRARPQPGDAQPGDRHGPRARHSRRAHDLFGLLQPRWVVVGGTGRRRPQDLRPRSGRRPRGARAGSVDARLSHRRERQVRHLVRGHLRRRRPAGLAHADALCADLGLQPARHRFAGFCDRPQHGSGGQVQRRAPRPALRDRRGRDGLLGLVQLPELPQSPRALELRVSGAGRRNAPDLSPGLLRADAAGDPVARSFAPDRRLHAGAAPRLHPAARFLSCERRRSALALDVRARRSDVSAVGAARLRSDGARGALPRHLRARGRHRRALAGAAGGERHHSLDRHRPHLRPRLAQLRARAGAGRRRGAMGKRHGRSRACRNRSPRATERRRSTLSRSPRRPTPPPIW